MKLTIDFDQKHIILNEDVNLIELYKKLRGIIPEGEWGDYKLIKTTEYVYYSYPTIIKEYPAYPNVWYSTSGTTNIAMLNENTTTDTVRTDLSKYQWSYTNGASGICQFEF